jgi:hypothetical protein
MSLVRDSGRVLNGVLQFVRRPERELQRQADVCRKSRKLGFSACQVLWKIAGGSASRMAAYRSSSFMCVTPMSEPPPPTNSSFWMDDMCSRVRPEVDDITT